MGRQLHLLVSFAQRLHVVTGQEQRGKVPPIVVAVLRQSKEAGEKGMRTHLLEIEPTKTQNLHVFDRYVVSMSVSEHTSLSGARVQPGDAGLSA